MCDLGHPIKSLVHDLQALRRFRLDDAAMARAVRGTVAPYRLGLNLRA